MSGEHHQVRARLLNLRQELDAVHRIAYGNLSGCESIIAQSRLLFTLRFYCLS